MESAQWTARQRELWARLCAFDLDEPGASLDFSRRLARENGWTHDFAKRIVEEYKRFLFLAMSAGHPVTPSDEVDQAWHLHLVYTRSYWNELCAEILCAPLHHGPTRGGAQEGAKFGQWYAQTRASYARFFGEEAPLDIWPDAATRFGEAPYFRRVNARRSWIIEKPQLRFPTRLSPILLIALALLGAGGAAWGAQINLNPWNWGGAAFLTLFWSLTLIGFGFVLWARSAWASPTDAQLPSVPVDAYAIARLRARNLLPVDAAIANMIAENRVELDDESELRQTGAPPSHPFERAVWDGIGGNGRPLATLRDSMKTRCEALDAELQNLGLLISHPARLNMELVHGLVPTFLLLLGVSKIVVGMSRQRPVEFLVMSCVAVLIITVVAWSHFPQRSGRGDALLAHMKTQHGRGSLSLPPLPNSPWATGAGVAGGAALAVALWGYDELDAFGMTDYRNRLQPPQTKGDGSSGCSSGGDSGGGDGGGDGGSGCGGCGGCGGGD